MEITVYTRTNDAQCKATMRALRAQGLEFTAVDVTTSPAGRAVVAELGYQSYPVVVAGRDHWCGYRPERVSELAQAAPPALSGEFAAQLAVADQVAAETVRERPVFDPMVAAQQSGFTPPDVAAAQLWAAPFVASAQRKGPIPAAGSPEWVALPASDPRKGAALFQAGLARIAEEARLPEILAQQIQENRRSIDEALVDSSRAVSESMSASGMLKPSPSHAELEAIRYPDYTREQLREMRGHTTAGTLPAAGSGEPSTTQPTAAAERAARHFTLLPPPSGRAPTAAAAPVAQPPPPALYAVADMNSEKRGLTR